MLKNTFLANISKNFGSLKFSPPKGISAPHMGVPDLKLLSGVVTEFCS